MIRIAYFSFDDTRFPSPAIRVHGPVAHLQGEVELITGHALLEGRPIGDAAAALRAADLVLVQRAFPRRDTWSVCEAILRSGKPVIYETDDALGSVPEHHNKPLYIHDVGPAVEEFAKHVALVTVATEPLAGLFRRINKRVVVLPNCLDPRLWSETLANPAPSEDGALRIGFVGSANHERDFAAVLPVLLDLLNEYPRLELVCYGLSPAGSGRLPRTTVVAPDYRYAEHPKRLAALGIDLAVAPLTPSRFNRCKSPIKFLEFGFLSVAGVFADLEPYRNCIVHGETGFLCGERPQEWRTALKTLIEDPVKRAAMGRNARQEVRSKWMLEPQVHRWLHAYERAMREASGSRSPSHHQRRAAP